MCVQTNLILDKNISDEIFEFFQKMNTQSKTLSGTNRPDCIQVQSGVQEVNSQISLLKADC